MRHTFLSILLSTSVLSFSFAQNSLGINEDALNKSRRLYEQGEYRAVVRMLSEVQNPSIDQQFLLEAGKMRQEGVHSTRLESLVMDFPAHPLAPEASFLLGSYYFSKKDWGQASDYLQVAGDPQALNPDDLSHDAFMKGYLYLQEEAYGKAKASLDQSENLGRSDAALFYYQGLASYYLGKKKEAGSYFEKTKSHAEYGSSSRYFLAQLLFEEGAYQQVIDIAQSEVVDEPSETNAAFYQLVGESYARQDLAVKASIYFEKAIDLSPGVPSPALLYQAGVARFKTGSKEKAIAYFLSSGIQKGAYAQLSAFQLGRIYVDQGEWELALAAYIEAAGLSDPEIREECLFQAGKLFAKQGNYTEAINYFNDYRNEFEDGKWVNEVNDYLTEAYLRTSNYDLAIKHLRDVGVERTAQKRMYQNVTFSKAQLLFNDGLYPEAIRWFDESLLYPIEENLASASHFFKGESYFYLSDYEKAISFYQNVLVKTFEVNYSIG
ncbi:MAG: tetratricopeptide repeat protein, partial [Bacteroidota bacterium]